MLDPQRTIGSMFGGQGLSSLLGGGQSQQPQQNMGQRFDISGMMNGGPLGFLSKLFSGFGKGNWWSQGQGETPQPNPTPQTPGAPAAPAYSADTLNPFQNTMGANHTGMTTFGSMLGRQPTL